MHAKDVCTAKPRQDTVDGIKTSHHSILCIVNACLCIFQYFLDHFLNCGLGAPPRGPVGPPQFEKWSKKIAKYTKMH